MTDQTDHRADPVQAVAEALSGWPIGHGYYSTQVATDEAQDMAELAVEAARPTNEREAKVAALMDAADDLEALVDDRHPDAANPDQWLRDRADRIEREGQA